MYTYGWVKFLNYVSYRYPYRRQRWFLSLLIINAYFSGMEYILPATFNTFSTDCHCVHGGQIHFVICLSDFKL